MNNNKSSISYDSLLEHLADPLVLPSYQAVAEAFRGQTQGEYEFWSFCNFAPSFEVLTKEYVEDLASYLLNRINQFQGIGISEPRILEIAAGDGRLAYFLQTSFVESQREDVRIIAIDDRSWKQPIKNHFPVEQMSYQEALLKIRPHIVICSWMPQGEDFSTRIRKTKSVIEYILIGDTNVCGHPWKTWGDWELWLSWSEDHRMKPLPWYCFLQRCPGKTPYQKDNFTRKEILLNTRQLCRTDRFISGGGWTCNSSTESFVRNKFSTAV